MLIKVKNTTRYKMLASSCLGIAVSFFMPAGSATTYTTTVDPAITPLANNDSVVTTNQVGIGDISATSPGIQLSATDKITVNTTYDSSDTTSSLRSAINLNNNTTNQLGTGTTVTAQYIDAIPPSFNLTLYGINLGSNANLNADALTINVSSTTAGSLYGIYTSSNVNLGSGSVINTNAQGQSNSIGLLVGKSLTADNLTVNVSGGGAIAMQIGSNAVVDLGQSSTLSATGIPGQTGSSSASGIIMRQGSSLTADSLTVIVQGDAQTFGGPALNLFDSGTSANLKNNSTLYTDAIESEGLYAFGTNLNFNADNNLTITTKGRDSQGAIAQGANTTVNLGKNATITTYGDSTYSASNIRNYSSSAVMARDGGKIIIGDGSNLTTYGDGFSNGIMIYGNQAQVEVGDNVTVTTEGRNTYGILSMSGAPSLTAGKNLRVISKGDNSTGVLSQNNSIVNLGQNALVQVLGSGSSGVELYNNGVLIANGSTFITTQADANTIVAAGTTKATLTGTSGTTTINAANGQGTALNFSGSSELIGTGAMYILGDIKNTATSNINLALGNNSYLLGSWTTDASATGTLSLGAGGLWTMTDDSNLTSLALNNSRIQFSGSDRYTLQVQNLSGNGTFSQRVDIEQQQGDLLDITGSSSGNHFLSILNYGNQPTDPTYEHLVVQTADGSANFALAHPVDAGAWQYELHRGTGANPASNWYLYRTNNITSATNAAINENRASYLLNYTDAQTLLQRMGDIRNNPDSGNLWVRAVAADYDVKRSGQIDSFDQRAKGMQIGADRKLSLANADIYLGATAGFTNSDQTYTHGSGRINAKSVGGYGTYIHSSGFYTDLVMKFNWQDQKFNVRDSGGARVTNDVSTQGFWSSVEVGQRFQPAKKGWYLESQMQIGFGHQSGDNSITSSGTSIKYDAYNSVLGLAGLVMGYEMKDPNRLINPYIKTSYVHEFDGKTRVKVGGDTFNPDLGSSWWTYGAGVTGQINNKHNLYVEVEQASGGNFNQPWQVSGGYRIRW